MIAITYEYECDVCRARIRPADRHEIRPGLPASSKPLPQPHALHVVGVYHVCSSCLAVADVALIQRIVG